MEGREEGGERRRRWSAASANVPQRHGPRSGPCSTGNPRFPNRGAELQRRRPPSRGRRPCSPGAACLASCSSPVGGRRPLAAPGAHRDGGSPAQAACRARRPSSSAELELEDGRGARPRTSPAAERQDPRGREREGGRRRRAPRCRVRQPWRAWRWIAAARGERREEREVGRGGFKNSSDSWTPRPVS
jgi:hypothetical protein